MRYLSLCSGIEAASAAWQPLGWTPVAFAEIEAFPSAVLKHHYPEVPNLGDITNFKAWPDLTVDLVCGGTPCQSFSVAGLRKGLADPRGNLSLTFLAIVDRYKPRYVIWENVPGVLSDDGGRSFASIVGGLGQLGYGWAYRVLDAQYVRVDGFGRAVPQRRRRVFLVGYLGDWRRAAAVLSEPESVLGHHPPRRQTGKGVAPTISARPTGGGGLGTDFDCDGGLIAEVAATLPAGSNSTGGDRQPGTSAETAATMLVAFAQNQRDEVRLMDVAGTLAAEPGMKQQTYVSHAIQAGALRENPNSGPDGVGVQDDHAYTLEARAEVQAVAFQPRFARNDRGAPSAEAGRTGKGDSAQCVQAGWAVRRLTPTECERLQGFPDGFTAIPHRGKPAADGPRYKALGNSWAVNCARWIGRRIEMVEQIAAEIEAERKAS